jgi:hypothetical protein
MTKTILKRFFWQNIICRFGVPRKKIVDSARQFDCHIFMDFYHQMGVKAAFASVYHPQPNGVVERTNALIFFTIKKVIEDQPKGKWVEELLRTIRSHNTFVSTNFTPFKLQKDEEIATTEEIKALQCQNKAGGHLQPHRS